MAIVGFIETTFPTLVAAINTSASESTDHNFPPSTVWAHVFLQTLRVNSDEGGADTFVSQFVDANGPHNVHFIGVFATNCTKIRYTIKLWDSWARALCDTQFFG